MSEQQRQIHTPGEPVVAAASSSDAGVVRDRVTGEVRPRAKPGPKPKVAALDQRHSAAHESAPSDDDLDAYDSDDLPPLPQSDEMLPMSEVKRLLAEQEARLAAQFTDAIHAAKASQDPATAAKLAAQRIAGQRLPTQAEAMAVLESHVANGIRPRAILTQDGYVTHREMTRVSDDLAKLPG